MRIIFTSSFDQAPESAGVAKVVFRCVSAAVLVAGPMTQVAQVVVGHSAVVFGTERARHT
jgi:hypothetical protein